MVDLALMERLRALPPLTYPATGDAKAQFLQSLFPVSGGITPIALPFMSGLDQNAALTQLERYFGYQRVDQTALAGTPPQLFQVVRGAFDPHAADAALMSCADCSAATRSQASGVPFYSWGGDFQSQLNQRLSPPAFDALGRGGRIAVTDQYVFRTEWTDGMAQLLAAYAGAGLLSKSAAHAAVATSLERLGGVTALITDQTQGPDQAAQAAQQGSAYATAWQPAAGTPVLAPYSLVAAGQGLGSDGQPFTCLVLVHASDKDANENASVLPQRVQSVNSAATGKPWSSLFPTVHTNVVGPVLEVMLPDSRVGATFLTQRDPLLLHR